MIHLKNVELYRNRKTILHNVSWDVEKGQHWTILGLNGSVKTTLLKVINGYLWPNGGSVEVLGETFGKTDIREVRKQMGWVSSAMVDQFNWCDPAIEIVLSGKFGAIRLFESVSDEEIDEAVGIMKLLHCDHLVNKAFELLSHGERQRVQIARALMARPKLLILDEPTTGLDLIERERLLQTIAKLANSEENPTLLYVTHHVEEILPCFTHILCMRDGEVFASGGRDELLTTENLSQFFGHPLTITYENNRAWVALK
ncbi:ABC transporter ATP-binding protein [Solibacillus sp. CAU 1738]|uniref:ABC transporter ATP-binding protein n=1 Tax=Solibacillus sp. CAU 1738 TaxID=3140363 RepID=UPI00326182E6